MISCMPTTATRIQKDIGILIPIGRYEVTTMDWRGRKYYAVSFSLEALDMRIEWEEWLDSEVEE